MWLVRLKGASKALDQLCSVFDQAELKVQKIGNDYWLCSDQLNEDFSEREIYDRGEALIEYLNSALKLYSNRADVLDSDGYFLKLASGELQNKFYAIGIISGAIKQSVFDDSLPDTRSFQLYSDYPNVRYVLTQFNNTSLDWFTLFNIFEAIEHDEQLSVSFGTSKKAIISWTNPIDYNRFFGTANWYRHSPYKKKNDKKTRFTLPARPMSLGEAESYIRTLVLAWLAFKVEQDE